MKALVVLLLPVLVLASDPKDFHPDDILTPGDSAFFQDNKISAQFLKDAESLHASGKLTPLSKLREQLTRKTTALTLPRARKEKVLSGPEIYDRALKSVVAVGSLYKCNRCSKWHMSSASGFFITESAFITNYHVVDNPEHSALFVRAFDGRVYSATEVLAANKQEDVAILKVDGGNFPGLPLGEHAPVGSEVFVLSHPDGHFYSFTDGIISRYVRSNEGASLMAITADYGKGSSGAPVLNEKGQVVGVASSTLSLYYDVQEGRKDNLQMVFKNCAPARSIHGLLQKKETK